MYNRTSETCTVAVTPKQRLRSVKRELRTRKNSIYIVEDIHTNTILLVQKLRYAADYINTHLAASQFDRVTTSGLYEAANTGDNTVGGHHKLRYLIHMHDLHSVRSIFNELLARCQSATILTVSPSYYDITSVAPEHALQSTTPDCGVWTEPEDSQKSTGQSLVTSQSTH
jgi:hypothetical protein